MANDISGGSVVGKLRFSIDKKSWDNLALFQKKLTSIKRQMSGLKGTIKVNAVVNDIKKVTKAVERAQKATKGGVGMEFGKAKGNDRTYASWWTDALKDKDRAARAVGTVTNEAEKRRYEVQKRWDKRRTTRLQREENIKFRMRGMSNTFSNRLGEGSLKTMVPQAQGILASTISQYRRGKISAAEFRQQVSATTQSLVKQGIVARNNAVSLRSLRTDLVQATAAYTAFSAGVNIFNTGKELQSMEAGMVMFAKDEAGVRETMSWLVGESERLGTNFMVAAQEFTKFGVVARNKMSQKESRELFTAFSEIATTQQMDPQRFHRGMNAIMQINGLPPQ
jgi:hypothetical protein